MNCYLPIKERPGVGRIAKGPPDGSITAHGRKSDPPIRIHPPGTRIVGKRAGRWAASFQALCGLSSWCDLNAQPRYDATRRAVKEIHCWVRIPLLLGQIVDPLLTICSRLRFGASACSPDNVHHETSLPDLPWLLLSCTFLACFKIASDPHRVHEGITIGGA